MLPVPPRLRRYSPRAFGRRVPHGLLGVATQHIEEPARCSVAEETESAVRAPFARAGARGVVASDLATASDLAALFGRPALVVGHARLRPSGAVQRTEAERIAPAAEADLAVFSALDTNVVVQLLRANEIGRRIDVRFGLQAAPVPPMLSAVTLGEAGFLARQCAGRPEKVQKLHDILRFFAILDLRAGAVVDRYVELCHGCRLAGRPMAQSDLWIAATAAAAGAAILTTDRDFEHFEPTVVTVHWIDPQSAPPPS
jgi:predicted nucleic acid-binding protein